MKRIIVKRIHSRRSFITNLIGAGLIINLPLINSCKTDSTKSFLSERQKSIFNFTFSYLFPDDDYFGPYYKSVKSMDYLLWLLQDKYVDPEENQYILNGVTWVDETAIEEFNIHFEKLNNKQKHSLYKTILKADWGENWLSRILTVIIESMFADPIYGSNPDGIVWKWIDHNPGQPRPNNNNKYPVILDRKKEDIIITNLNQL